MGVTYKLRDEVIHFIVSQRQANSLTSCRQLAESASRKFGLRLSKSSVHDVLKESGIITPRGRKPKNKFKIPQAKKKQIQSSLSQVKLAPSKPATPVKLNPPAIVKAYDMETSAEYEGAGRIFLKAVFWDLGAFSQDNIKESDWTYYLTHAKGIRVVLEDKKDFFIDLPLPIERCIREAVDGLINNIYPLIVHKVSDEALFRVCMSAQAGFKIKNVSIVDYNDHIIVVLHDIVDKNRIFTLNNRVFVESRKTNQMDRVKTIFIPQDIDNNDVIENILGLRGFDSINTNEKIVTLLINEDYNNKTILEAAAEKFNGMYLRDEKNRLVKLKIQTDGSVINPKKGVYIDQE